MGYNTTMLIIFGVVILVFGIAFLVSKRKEAKRNTKPMVSNGNSTETNGYKKNSNASVAKDDIFNFMEFDKIQDDMIIQQHGEKYTAVIRCKGINYNLMSEVEQLSVEEGFMNFLNTLKFPVQLYVQAQAVNLKSNLAEYKEHMKAIHDELDEINSEYNLVINSIESTDEEIEDVENRRNSIVNVLEYGQDIMKYVERLSLNKSMLQRSFYVLVSYYKSELSNASSFSKEELLDVCYSELFTRVQNIISGLSMCSVYASILSSNDIAELLYSAYNRDDKNYMSVQQALESGFYRLYSTSEDAVTKKRQKLAESIKQEAEYKAISALNKALEEGTYTTQTDVEDAYDQESSKQAIEIIKTEKVSEDIKRAAKKIVVDEYKKAKEERYAKQDKYIDEVREKIEAIKGTQEETVEGEEMTQESQDGEPTEELADLPQENNSTQDDESIV